MDILPAFDIFFDILFYIAIVIIIGGGFTLLTIAFLVVSILNIQSGYLMFNILLYTAIVVLTILLAINMLSGSPLPNSIYLSAFIPLLSYVLISRSRVSSFNSSTASK